MAFFAYKIWTTETIEKVYNPFEILDIGTVSCNLLSCRARTLACSHKASLERDYQRHQVTLQEIVP